MEIPVPIPNTEVKRSRADGTAARPRESRSLPAFFLHIFSNCWRLYIVSFETDSWMAQLGPLMNIQVPIVEWKYPFPSRTRK